MAIVAIFLGAAGCRSVAPPDLAFSDPVVAARSEEGVRLEFLARISNPNAGALPLKEFTYEFAMNGDAEFQTRRAAGATLGGESSQLITLPVILTPDEAARVLDGQARSYTLSGELIYVAPGALAEALFDTGLQTPSVSFEHGGSAELTGPP